MRRRAAEEGLDDPRSIMGEADVAADVIVDPLVRK
jgi:hypothetical protein